MARFSVGNTYYIKKNVNEPSIKEIIVYSVEEVYDSEKVLRAKGPMLFHIISNCLYIGGKGDYIPSAYNKKQDFWKSITIQKGKHLLFEFLFEKEFRIIKIKS